jgi:hypothetical protein
VFHVVANQDTLNGSHLYFFKNYITWNFRYLDCPICGKGWDGAETTCRECDHYGDVRVNLKDDEMMGCELGYECNGSCLESMGEEVGFWHDNNVITIVFDMSNMPYNNGMEYVPLMAVKDGKLCPAE